MPKKTIKECKHENYEIWWSCGKRYIPCHQKEVEQECACGHPEDIKSWHNKELCQIKVPQPAPESSWEKEDLNKLNKLYPHKKPCNCKTCSGAVAEAVKEEKIRIEKIIIERFTETINQNTEIVKGMFTNYIKGLDIAREKLLDFLNHQS